ncbi:MAG: glycolate oxidase iron-sulfur subunit, partial [Gammaproteobacteria bacterium]|nr:glycolate oxidase iron-sulfur subunit [Gammaproteobacteria bacterium]
AEKTLDLSEYLQRFDLTAFARKTPLRVAWHPPCTLQHGQGVRGVVEGLLDAVGVERVPVAEGHLCCGAAGTNALLEPAMAQALRARKLAHLEKDAPERIVTANIGCELHLAAAAGRPVSHWITLLAEALER